MIDIVSYRAALIALKNKIDVYKKNKLSVTIFSILFFLSLLAVATLLMLKFGLSQHYLKSPAAIAMLSFAMMLLILGVGYWLIFKNPAVDAKRQALFESLVAILVNVSPHSELYRVLIEDYKNKVIGEHALLNMVLAELKRTETL